MMKPFVVRNNMAIAGWLLTFFWVGALVMFTWLLATERDVGQVDRFVVGGIMIFFWMLAFVLIAEFMTKPRIRLEITPRALQLQLAWLIRRRRLTLSGEDLQGLALVRGQDSDGDPHFKLILTIPPGRDLILCESRDPERVEGMHRDILARTRGLA